VRRLIALAALALLAACSAESDPRSAPSAPASASRPASAPRPASARQPAAARLPVFPAEAAQLVVATVDDWGDVTAELARFAREPGGAWKPVGASWPAVVGARGSAWGRGLHGRGAPAGRGGPVKREGDGKSPAGVFALGAAFGYEAAPPPGAREPYTQVDDSWVCVDDPRSARYNRVFNAGGVTPDWSSFEAMRRPDDLYRWVVVVDHNADAAAGDGSCIFLHVWHGRTAGTAGCTAMERPDMEALLTWLDPAARPVFVLLPAAERDALRGAWGLP
jgi:L,D-peptidoglycan transpeptidase YkuD (ErfK/YbiS/YcfS/YnhG family)